MFDEAGVASSTMAPAAASLMSDTARRQTPNIFYPLRFINARTLERIASTAVRR